MMALNELAKRAGKFATDNSPAILTAIGVTGTLTTAYLTGKASFKAAEIIAEEKIRLDLESPSRQEPSYPLETKEKIQLVWKLYIPAAGTVVLTVASIIGANRIGTRRAAAMATAYALAEKGFSEYKDKVIEKIGQHKEQGVRDELAQDRVDRNPVSTHEVIITSGGDVLCYDSFTGRYFKSDMETLKKAQNDLNYRVLNDYYASLSDFYNLIGLPTTSYSDEVGWNANRMLELEFSTTLSEDGRPCISIGFAVNPIRDYYRIN